MTLREARDRHKPKLTQVQLAKRSRVDQTYVSLIERGLRFPSDDIKERLAKALGIAPSRIQFPVAPESVDSVTTSGDKPGHSAPTEALTR